MVFRQFRRKAFSLFACLGREVIISVLSVATLSAAKPASISVETFRVDSTAKVNREVWLSDVGVTGSRAPLSLGQAAKMVTVLSRDDIQAVPVRSVNDLLKLAAGVDVRQRGPLGAQTDISIRGGTQEQITIMLNGINICDPQTGHNVLDLPIDLGEIERIEVMEGPAGRVIGTSSLVGDINIVTKPSHKTSSKEDEIIHLALEGGSFGYASTSARMQLPPSRESKCKSSFSTGYTRSDGYQRSKGGKLNSDYQGVRTFFQGLYDNPTVTVSWHAGLSIRGLGSNTFYSAKYDEQYEHTAKLYTALQGETKRGWLHLKPAVYWNRGYDRFELIRDKEQPVPFNRHRTDVFGINLNAYFDSPLGRTAIGAEFRNEDIISTNLGEPLNNPHAHYVKGLNRSNLNFHVEHNVLLRRLTLSCGFVCAQNTWSEMPFTVYPGIDASYRLADNWKLYASFNSSLRMPTFTELYYSVGGHMADPHLKPEEMRAVEGGVKYLSRCLSLSASVFHHHGHNLIDWVLDTRQADAVWKSVNHTKINTLGQEVNLRLDLTQAFNTRAETTSILNISYCHLHQIKDEQTGLQSRYSLEYLRHKLTASLQLPLARRLGLTLTYRFQDRMGTYTDTAGNICSYRPYSVVDARLAWQLPHCSVYAEANNLFSTQYVDYGNVKQPGLWMTAGVRYSW